MFPTEKKSKKILFSRIFSTASLSIGGAIPAGLIMYVAHTMGVRALLASIQPPWLLGAALCVPLSEGMDTLIFYGMGRSAGCPVKSVDCFDAAYVGEFYYGLGLVGAPVQLKLMYDAGMSTTYTASIYTWKAVANTMVYTGYAVATLAYELFWWQEGPGPAVAGAGTLITPYVFLYGLALFTAVRPEPIQRLIHCIPTFLAHHQRVIAREGMMDKGMEKVDEFCAQLRTLKGNHRMLTGLSADMFVGFVVLFTIPSFLYRGLGLTGGSFWELVLVQCLVLVLSRIIILPDSAGDAEGSFYPFMGPLFGQHLAMGLVLWRFAAFLEVLLLGGTWSMLRFTQRSAAEHGAQEENALDGKHARLKLKMLLLVVLGTLIARGVSIFLLEVVVDGVLQDPFAHFFLWTATTLLDQSPEGVVELCQRYIRNSKQEILTLGTVLLMLIVFYLAIGRFTRWLNDVRSATRRLAEAQAEPVELPRKLAPIQEDLNAIQWRLRTREAAARENEQRRGDLVAFLAHDLKTPLTPVVGYLILLWDDPDLDAAQRTKFTGIALDKAWGLEELLGEFFDITRTDPDSGPGERQPIQLPMLLEQLADEFYLLFAEKQPRCTVGIQHHLVVLGDPDKLARVFDNVLHNVVSYSTPGNRVDIQAKAVGRQAETIIRNEGLEIPEGELANVFQKFYRLDVVRSSRTDGTGLELTIAKEIMESYGGNIRYESNGRLTSFVISLPLYKEVRHVFKQSRAGLSEPKQAALLKHAGGAAPGLGGAALHRGGQGAAL